MTVLPAAGYFNDPARTNFEAKTAQDAILAFIRQTGIGATPMVEYTIATGSITPAQPAFSVDTESNAASDNLDNILLTNFEDGQVVILTAEDAARVVTVRHGIGGSGQILLAGDQNVILNPEIFLWLMRDGTAWLEINRTSTKPNNFYAGSAGGTGNALTGTTTDPLPAYYAGLRVSILATAANSGATTININALGSRSITKQGTTALSGNDILNGKMLDLQYDGTQFQLMNPSASDAWMPIPGGRLTLTTAVPVTASNVSAASTIYYTPYIHNKIMLYTGSGWIQYTFSELSKAITGLTSGLPYDVFLNYNSGTPQLEFLAWTNGTTRATAIALQDGVWVKSGTPTQRYLGSFYTTSTTTTEDSFTKRFLFNAFNRTLRAMTVAETASSWTYTTETYRQVNANTANKVELMIGLFADMFFATSMGAAKASTGTPSIVVGIGLNSTSVNSGVGGGCSITTSTIQNGTSTSTGSLGIGYNYIAMLEGAQAFGTTTWYSGGTGGSLNANIAVLTATQIM